MILMERYVYSFSMWLACLAVGCSSLSGLTTPQGWSENYALLEGTVCTSLEMIDGDLETVGRSPHRIFITLPERKSIHRIVIRGTNIEDVIVYAGLGSGDDEWKIVKQIKNNQQPTIDMRVTTVTDKIRLVVGGTFDDVPQPGRYSPQYDAMIGGQIQRGTPYAQEIELYGLASKPKEETPQADETSAPPIEEETPEF
jgi:hypothetical protein